MGQLFLNPTTQIFRIKINKLGASCLRLSLKYSESEI